MPVPLPSDKTRQNMHDQGYGLARDDADHYKDIKGRLDAVDPTMLDQMSLSGGEVMRTIPLRDPLVLGGKTFYPISVDQDSGELIAYDPSIIPGEVKTVPPPQGSKAAPTRQPNNYVRIPITNPLVSAFLNKRREEGEVHRKSLLEVIKSYNKFIADIATPDKLKGTNLVQIPLMVFKEREHLILPRLQELRSMERAVETKVNSYVKPSSITDAEAEWLKAINDHTLNLQDEVDTISKLYKGKEEKIISDIDNGTLNPSDELRKRWFADVEVIGADGLAKTKSRLQAIIDEKLKKKEEEQARSKEVKDEVKPVSKILERVPEKDMNTTPTFTGPSENILGKEQATLAGIKDEIKALEALDLHLSEAVKDIVELESKSDQYLLSHPEEYKAIIDRIRIDASLFIRRHAGSIQNKPKTWKTEPKDFKTMPDSEKALYDKNPEGGLTLPGAVNASFVGKSIASAGVSLYLNRILDMIKTIDSRISGGSSEGKPENVQASSKSFVKNAQWGIPDDSPEGQSAALASKKMVVLRKLKWLTNPDSVNKVFEKVAPFNGVDPSSYLDMDVNLKFDLMNKAINSMTEKDLTELARFIDTL